MDILAGLLYEVRSHGALFGQNLLRPPWAIRFSNRAPLVLLAMLRGRAWVAVPGHRPVPLHGNDLAVVVGPAEFTVTGDPDRAVVPHYVVSAPDACTGLDGGEIPPEHQLGVRTCGDHLDSPNALLTGAYPVSGRLSERLLSVLPAVLVVPGTGEPRPILDLTVAEIVRDDPGQQAVLDRLLDLLLLATLREWFTRPEAHPPPWYRAQADPVVGKVLRAIHEEPAAPWTVAALAGEAGVSRATFARRFHDLLGEPPMAYVTGWRLSLAADLLRRGDATVAAVARQVGYANGYALSVAFKRHFGTRPSEHRRAAAAPRGR